MPASRNTERWTARCARGVHTFERKVLPHVRQRQRKLAAMEQGERCQEQNQYSSHMLSMAR